MFGFLGSPCQACASDNSHSTYRSFFCGLSGALRDDYSPAARFLVNRDSTFLSLVTASLGSSSPATTLRTCCQPIAVPKPLFSDDLHARYAAAVTICGLSAKLDDDRSDETGLRRNAARIFGRALSPLTDRAISLLNSLHFPTSDVVATLQEQSAIESRKPDLLEAAAPTATAYETIFGHTAHLTGTPEEQSKLQSLGRTLGRLIYWKDAHDDREEDASKGRFNPLVKAEPGELQHHFGEALLQFDQAATFSGAFQNTILEIVSSTHSRHQSLAPENIIAQLKNQPAKSRKNKKKKTDKSCSDYCDPGGSLCDCCPCDSCCLGCDCSP